MTIPSPPAPVSARAAVAEKRDIIFITLDSLRFDVAQSVLAEGRSPHLSQMIGPTGWEMRHSPATFTYAAHQSFFAGFLPTPVNAPAAERLFALRFEGSRSIGASTVVLDGPDIVSGLKACGYHTICVGGVGFFNKRNPISQALPALFDDSTWSPSMGPVDPRSPRNQVACAVEALAKAQKPVFLFINFSATHHPTRVYVRGAREDSIETQAAALAAIDAALPPLIDALRARGRCFILTMSDHGDAFGEDGYHGHRLAHPAVLNVPFAAQDVLL